jgi:ankyrin repeat protein
LIEGGADLNAPKLGRLQKPLHVATTCRNWTAVELLLEKGADVDAVNGSGLTPLIIASQMNDVELACLFLGRGADINKPSDRGWTSLYYAVAKGSYAATSLLIKHGARDMRLRKVTQRLSRTPSYHNLSQVSVSLSFDSRREFYMTPEQTVELKGAGPCLAEPLQLVVQLGKHGNEGKGSIESRCKESLLVVYVCLCTYSL